MFMKVFIFSGYSSRGHFRGESERLSNKKFILYKLFMRGHLRELFLYIHSSPCVFESLSHVSLENDMQCDMVVA